MEGFGAVGVGEIDATYFELAFHLVGTISARRLFLIFGIEDVEEAFGIDEGIVEGVEDELQLGNGGCDVGEEHDVVHDLTDAHAWIFDEDEVGGEDDDEHSADLLHEALHTVETEGGLADEHLIVGELRLDVPLLLALDVLAIEGLDDVHALDDAHQS